MVGKIKTTKKPRVLVAMSGGVDSSVAAALLKKQGYEVIGAFMQFWFPSGETYGENRCCSLESFNEAAAVAKSLDIPIYKLNFGKEFKKQIVDEFLAAYRAGQTPNPCVACNKFIKFDLLWKKAKVLFDVDYLATGHYVSIEAGRGKYKMIRSKDKNKDQSYFLYNLDQTQLKHLLFPLGGYKKEKVRQLAKKLNFGVHDKKDSQEVCFVGSSHNQFLKKYLKLKSGKIVDEKGATLGDHQGLALYTAGQRSGLGLSGGPWYVCGKDLKTNKLIVTKSEKSSAVYGKELICDSVNWLSGKVKLPLKCQAQVRYHGVPANCLVEKYSKDKLKVTFVKSQRAIVPGQSVVFYSGQELLGGGIII